MIVDVLIPARLKSKRLKNKPLIKIGQLTLIEHVIERVKLSKLVNSVTVCADDKKIFNFLKSKNYKCILTNKKFKNGTERIASVLKKFNSDLIIDVQCDCLFLDPKELDRVIKFHLKKKFFDIVLPYQKYTKKNEINSVKIVSDKKDKILFMSRSDIPSYFRHAKKKYFKRHEDFISFKPESLKKFINLKISENELLEGIELLRAIDNNMSIGTFQTKPLFRNVESINTVKDLKQARRLIKKCPILKKYQK
ncbi:NTP transferase domain-containing protein [Candidatus Pelagibacter sp.]|nr:NTP transferase domain-containing protein [Candidatus Pelagibacter sp.]